MIKVNLLRNQGQEGPLETEVMNIGGGDGNAQKENAIKIVLILVFTVLLYLYEGYNIDTLKAQSAKVTKEVTDLRQKLTKVKASADKAKEQQALVEELERKISVIKTLSKTRLRELKALDFLQNIIPEKVWLDTIAYSEQGVSLNGYAVADDPLNDFMARLEDKQIYTDVILLKSSNTKAGTGTVKQFEIAAKLVAVD